MYGLTTTNYPCPFQANYCTLVSRASLRMYIVGFEQSPGRACSNGGMSLLAFQTLLCPVRCRLGCFDPAVIHCTGVGLSS